MSRINWRQACTKCWFLVCKKCSVYLTAIPYVYEFLAFFFLLRTFIVLAYPSSILYDEFMMIELSQANGAERLCQIDAINCRRTKNCRWYSMSFNGKTRSILGTSYCSWYTLGEPRLPHDAKPNRLFFHLAYVRRYTQQMFVYLHTFDLVCLNFVLSDCKCRLTWLCVHLSLGFNASHLRCATNAAEFLIVINILGIFCCCTFWWRPFECVARRWKWMMCDESL